MEKSREDSIHSLCIYRLARMFCIVAAAFAVVILCLPFSIQASDTTIEESATVNPKKVLIIGSYTIAWASYPQMISGIQNEIGEQAELQYYFMDTKNVSDEFASSLLKEFLNTKKEQNIQYDAYIFLDDAALNFGMANYSTYFKDVPCIFAAVNSPSKAEAAYTKYGMEGIVETAPISETIELAEKIYPDASQIVVVTDDTVTGKGNLEQVQNIKDRFPDLKFTILDTSELTLAQIKEQLQGLTTKSILLYELFSEDADGNQYTSTNAIDIVTSSASIPAFKADEMGIDDGLIGGCVISFDEMGKHAGAKAAAILSESEDSSEPVSSLTPFYEFNYPVLVKYSLKISQLPANAKIVNQPESFLATHYFTIIMILASCVILLLVIGSVRLRGRIKERNRLNQVLEKQNEALKDLNTQRTELMSRVSHELRTPMNAVIGLAQLGYDNDPNAPDADYFKKISSSGQYLLGIVNEILDMNKIEGGKIKLIERPASWQEIEDEIMTIIHPLITEKKIIFAIQKKELMQEYVFCDKQKVEQILINLLTNAVKFTPKGGSISLSILQDIEGQQQHMTFVVKDTGCGMSQEFLPKLFHPFSQENRNPSLYGTGTGLGLAISRDFARLMHGDITADSIEGKGSTFTVTAVLRTCTPEEALLAEKETIEAGTSKDILSGKKVLLVEDNQLNRMVAEGVLKKFDMQCENAADGSQGLKMFAESSENDYDLILMDLQMPVMNGFEAAKAIRQLDRKDAKDVPIIAMTADIFEDSIKKAYEAGMNAYITKPLDITTMMDTISKNLRK